MHARCACSTQPARSIVLDDYVRFLYPIGARSLPEAFVRIAVALRRGNAQKMLEKTNTVFLLEVLLQRHVYGRPLELKRDAGIRDAVLFILDSLVETGSSAVFRNEGRLRNPARIAAKPPRSTTASTAGCTPRHQLLAVDPSVAAPNKMLR